MRSNNPVVRNAINANVSTNSSGYYRGDTFISPPAKKPYKEISPRYRKGMVLARITETNKWIGKVDDIQKDNEGNPWYRLVPVREIGDESIKHKMWVAQAPSNWLYEVDVERLKRKQRALDQFPKDVRKFDAEIKSSFGRSAGVNKILDGWLQFVGEAKDFGAIARKAESLIKTSPLPYRLHAKVADEQGTLITYMVEHSKL